MAALEKSNIPSSSCATTANINPFPTKVAITLNITPVKARLTNPSRNPLSPGIILQGPDFRNLAIPNPPLETDNISVKGTDGGIEKIPFDTSIQMRICI